MRKTSFVLFLVILVLVQLLPAQDAWHMVSASDTVVNFGAVEAYTQHSRTVTLTNNSDKNVQILNAAFEEVEFTTDLAPGTLSPGEQKTFHIFFESDQNVNYTDFLHIEFDHGIHPLIIEASAQVYYADSYYDATQNKWGSDLKAALHNIIKGHTQYDYGSLWDILSDTDQDPNNPNNVILIYTGWSYAASDHGGDPDQWNREHVWAKSHGDFGTTPPAGTDVHHIRPCDVSVNSKRGNLDFDNGGSLYTDPDGVTYCYYDGDSWEPRDEDKGDVARMMYYMVVRYEGEEGYDLELVDYTPSTTSNEPIFGKKSTLYQWHWADTVDSWERRRNERIYSNWQHNRNPFIDHPEFADRLPSISGDPVPSEPEIVVSPLTVQMDTIGFNSTAYYYLAMINTGVSDLIINEINSTNSQFAIDQTSMTLSPETYDYLQIRFQSEETEGGFSTTIQIYSNDSNEGLIEVPVSIQVAESVSFVEPQKIPQDLTLLQNFPNPFNPQTTIRYYLSSGSNVRLVVYDAAGRFVEQLIQQNQQAGWHEYRFVAKQLASGVYYLMLQTKQQKLVKKMVLIR